MAYACAPPPAPKVGSTAHPPDEPVQPVPRPPPESKPVPEDVVERAALPFHAVRLADGEALSQSEFFDELARQDAVCVAEHHDNPHHHWAELFIVQELARRALSSGRKLGLGLEMFEARFQRVLDDYTLGKIDQTQLLERTEYDTRWGFPFQYYEPQIDHAIEQGGVLVALNAPREQVRRVAQEGFDALTEHETRRLGGFDLANDEHRAQFERLMQGPPHTGAPEHLYEAQVLWDESMANTASAWLGARIPARQLVILAGSAHCHDTAIPSRLRRRLRARVVSVKPSIEHGDSEPEAEDQAGYDYAFVMTAG